MAVKLDYQTLKAAASALRKNGISVQVKDLIALAPGNGSSWPNIALTERTEMVTTSG